MVIHWAQIKQYADKQSENTQHKTENYQKPIRENPLAREG
jgi:hypothetical protein